MVSSTARDVRPETEAVTGADVVVDAALQETSNRLMDSLVHDARNPLNALSINLEVLTEKLKDEDGQVPAKVQKNLKAMRDQIGRVDGILREYAEFMAPRGAANASEDLSALVTRVVGILGHEGRVKRVQARLEIEPGVQVRLEEPALARFLLVQAVFRAMVRAPEGTEVLVTLRRDGAAAFFVVSDGGAENDEPFPLAVQALERASERVGAQIRLRGGEVRLAFAVL